MRETTVGSDFDDPLGGEDLPREVEAAAGEQAVAAPGTEPDKDPEPWNVRRLAPYVSVPRLKVAERARHGDPEALRILRSCCETDLSDHQIKEWCRRSGWHKLDEPGTAGFSDDEHQRRLRLAAWVLHRTERGLSFEEACEEVGRLAVTKLCFLPAATTFLKPETVKEAYEYAATCGDPRWERVKRLVPRFAKRERLANRLGSIDPPVSSIGCLSPRLPPLRQR